MPPLVKQTCCERKALACPVHACVPGAQSAILRGGAGVEGAAGGMWKRDSRQQGLGE